VGRVRLLERVDLVVSEVQAPDVPVVSEPLHQVPRTQQQLLFLDGKGVGHGPLEPGVLAPAGLGNELRAPRSQAHQGLAPVLRVGTPDDKVVSLQRAEGRGHVRRSTSSPILSAA
jgi:hypothetical protein